MIVVKLYIALPAREGLVTKLACEVLQAVGLVCKFYYALRKVTAALVTDLLCLTSEVVEADGTTLRLVETASAEDFFALEAHKMVWMPSLAQCPNHSILDYLTREHNRRVKFSSHVRD